MTHPGISSDETYARLHRSGHHDECSDNKRNAKDEADHSEHNASDDLDNIVRYSFANYPNDVLDTISGLCCPVVIGERITDHPQDCSEVSVHSSPCAENLSDFASISWRELLIT